MCEREGAPSERKKIEKRERGRLLLKAEAAGTARRKKGQASLKMRWKGVPREGGRWVDLALQVGQLPALLTPTPSHTLG